MELVVLRYGHRIVRDYRVTTHCCLVARALGAKKIIIQGTEDAELAKSIEKVNIAWGTGIELEFAENWRPILKKFKKEGFKVMHLTAYGEPLQKKIKELRKEKKLLLVIGSQKVESQVYQESDYNIAVSNQPHSEIAALAIALDWLQKGKELVKEFKGAKIKIVPQAKGKKTMALEEK